MRKIFALTLIVVAYSSMASAFMAKPDQYKSDHLFCYEPMSSDRGVMLDLGHNGRIKIQQNGTLLIEEFNWNLNGGDVDPDLGVEPSQRALVLAGVGDSGKLLFRSGKPATAIVYAIDSTVLTDNKGQITVGLMTYICK